MIRSHRFSPLGPVFVLLIAFANQSARAQDLRVYTTVVNVSENPQRPPVIARTLTLFHAGKVYDHMEDVGEVVILEPIHNRFILLDGNYTAATVPFEELRHFLEVAAAEARRYSDELRSEGNPKLLKAVPALEFQLQPKFAQSFDPVEGRLKLMGDYLSYEVRTSRIPSAQSLERYLTYADWAARLNYVLHPQTLYPESRLALNRALRERQALPTTVDLRAEVGTQLHLRARHEFGWELQSYDKAQINKWERLLESSQVRWVTFHEYQQQVVTAASR